jgi:hypothetical protein
MFDIEAIFEMSQQVSWYFPAVHWTTMAAFLLSVVLGSLWIVSAGLGTFKTVLAILGLFIVAEAIRFTLKAFLSIAVPKLWWNSLRGQQAGQVCLSS